MGMIGPTLPSLAIQTESTREQLSFLIAVSYVGRMLGSVLSGSLSDKLSAELQLAICTTGVGVSLGLVPWCPGCTSLGIVKGLAGLCIGCITAGK